MSNKNDDLVRVIVFQDGTYVLEEDYNTDLNYQFEHETWAMEIHLVHPDDLESWGL